MSDSDELNKRGNHTGQFHQGVGGWAEYAVRMTETKDTARHEVTVPPGKVIPVIFLPGVMGSNLRMSKVRQEQLKRPDNRSWRPDDIAASDVIRGEGFGGWFKNASPRDRQLVFDPNETEVEYYHYTESNGRFDPDGVETKAADARHQNVPSSLPNIPPLMGEAEQMAPTLNPDRTKSVGRGKAAQVARWRGWSEVLFAGSYGTMLRSAEHHLNNMMDHGRLNVAWRQNRGVGAILMQDPKEFGASSGKAITEDDLKKIAACWYPVHAMGYNFIKSNGVSAVAIAERIRGLVKGYVSRGFKCDEVIIITHSMGGLLARALIHPSYGNMLNDKDVKILGIYHNVMPTIGAAGAYKRMRFGFEEKTDATNYAAQVLGIDGEHATAILANAPAPLEMLPGIAYGEKWLRVVDIRDKELWSWPRGKEAALESIYLQPAKAWWRLVNPEWVNPGKIGEKKGGGIGNVLQRLRDASKFLQSIEKTFHPNTYASYCASKKRLSYGEVVFKVTEGMGSGLSDPKDKFVAPPPEEWVLVSDDKKGLLTVQAGSRILKLQLEVPSAPGDETVPSARSARHITGTLFVHGEKEDTDYEHQNSYANTQVLASMLYSIVQIAKTAKWGK